MSSPAELNYIDFWDVGQADCSVLHLSSGSIIIIDVGKRGSPLVAWLANQPRKIDAIIITHNDADHAGALASLVEEHKTRIGAIYMSLDRSKSELAARQLFRAARAGEKAGHYPLRNIETDKIIWMNADGSLRLKFLHPSFAEGVEAFIPNDASAITALERDNATLAAWTGDVSLPVAASKLTGKSPWLMTGPHHGGPNGYKAKPDSHIWTSGIGPRRSFISVGKNSYDHPRPRYIQLLGRTGCQVVCSQITRACDLSHLEKRRPVFPGSAVLGLPAVGGSGVPCRGSWRVYYRNGSLVPDEYDAEHLAKVATLRRPLCLRGRGWRKGDPIPPQVI